MWSELVQLAQRRSRTEPGARQADARVLTALYGALSNCQIAFERLEHDASGDKTDAVLAMDVLFMTLHNVQPSLRLFDEPLARELTSYVRTEVLSGSMPTSGQLKQQVETLRRLLSLEAGGSDVEVTAPAAFSGACRELARFMRRSHSVDELLPS